MDFSNKQIGDYLKQLTDALIPYQFVHLTGLPLIEKICQEFNLPKPQVIGGNIIIGDLSSKLILVSHLDEISFGIKKIAQDGCYLALYHNYEDNNGLKLKIIGIREKEVQIIGDGVLEDQNGELFCKTSAPIKMGDRVVYNFGAEINGDQVTAKTIDGRAGVLAQLLAASELFKQRKDIAVIFTEGEEGDPKGYFARNFARVLPLIPKDSLICFTYGVYPNERQNSENKNPPKEAFIIPHSSHGKGYIVNPMRFAWLRDEIIPKALERGVKLEISETYSSRADDWALTTNQNTTFEPEAFFVDFGSFGRGHHQVPMTIDINTIKNVAETIILIGEQI